MSPTRSLFRLFSFTFISCCALLSQQQASFGARGEQLAPKAYVVSVRLLVDGSSLETPLDDSLAADLKRSLVLEDSATGQRFDAKFEVQADRLVTQVQLAPAAVLRPRLVNSEYFEGNPDQLASAINYAEGKRLVRFPVTAKTKTLNLKMVDGSASGKLTRMYPQVFEELKEYAAKMLVLQKGLPPKNVDLDLQYAKGSIRIPAHFWADRNQYVLALKPNPAVTCKPVRLGGALENPLPIRLQANEIPIRIVPLDVEQKRFSRGDMPKIVIRYKDIELAGIVVPGAGYYSTTLIPALRYRIDLTHQYYECEPWENELDAGSKEIKLPTTLSLDRYPLQLVTPGKFIEGRLPDSVVCSSANGKRLIIPFRADVVGVPKRYGFDPPVTIKLRASDEGNWRLEANGLQRGGRNRASIERLVNSAARFSFRIDAGNDLKGQRPRVSLVAESLPGEWRDLQIPVNQPKAERISWPRRPMNWDTVRVSVDKPGGTNLREDVNWQDAKFDTTLKWDGVSEIRLQLYKLPTFEVLYADLTQDNIDRAILLERISSHLESVQQRKDVKDCYLWLSNGVDRSYGYSDKAREILNDLSRVQPLVQDFYNELRRVVEGFTSSCKWLQRVQPEYHLFLSQSSFNWIRADVQTLARVMRELGITEEYVTFYVQTERRVDKSLGTFRVVNLPATSKK